MANKNYLEEMIDSYCHPSVVLWRAIELKTITNLFDKEKIILQNPILDLGCGEGKIAESLFGKNKIDQGLDNWPDMVESAKKSGVYKKVILGDACQLPFQNEAFKMVFSNCVIEHIPDIDKVLSEVSRVLKKDGLFIFTVPSAYFFKNLSLYRILNTLGLKFLAQGYSRYRNEKLNHYNCFALSVWEKKLTVNKFKIKSQQFYISYKTLFLWDLLALLIFPFAFLSKILKLPKLSFPFRTIILRNLFNGFYQENAGNDKGAALLVIAKKV